MALLSSYSETGHGFAGHLADHTHVLQRNNQNDFFVLMPVDLSTLSCPTGRRTSNSDKSKDILFAIGGTDFGAIISLPLDMTRM